MVHEVGVAVLWSAFWVWFIIRSQLCDFSYIEATVNDEYVSAVYLYSFLPSSDQTMRCFSVEGLAKGDGQDTHSANGDINMSSVSCGWA